MTRAFLLLLLLALFCETAFAQNKSIRELQLLFDYDQNAPLDVKEVGTNARAVV